MGTEDPTIGRSRMPIHRFEFKRHASFSDLKLIAAHFGYPWHLALTMMAVSPGIGLAAGALPAATELVQQFPSPLKQPLVTTRVTFWSRPGLPSWCA